MWIPKERITVTASRSRGPGGQGVNKTESKIEIRFCVDQADWIPEPTRLRFKSLFANRITLNGDFILTCEENRSREQNLQACFARLREMLEQAAIVPKTRRKTKPTWGSQVRRVDSKKKRSAVKSSRKTKNWSAD